MQFSVCGFVCLFVCGFVCWCVCSGFFSETVGRTQLKLGWVGGAWSNLNFLRNHGNVLLICYGT